MLTIDEVFSRLVDVPDFPQKGIIFKDAGDIYASPECMNTLKKVIVDAYKDKGLTKVVGLESRGFIFGAMIAAELNLPFVPFRKPGKLPGDVLKYTYDLEYKKGESMEVQRRQLSASDVVLIHDDILATGGTASAAIALCNMFGIKRESLFVNFLLEIDFLQGRKAVLPQCREILTLKHI